MIRELQKYTYCYRDTRKDYINMDNEIFISSNDIDIIDPDANNEDELSDSYVGKVVLDCSVCHSKIYKDPSEIVIDEVEELAKARGRAGAVRAEAGSGFYPKTDADARCADLSHCHDG